MELTYQAERELHNIVTTTTVTFIGDLDEWKQLVSLMHASTAQAMLRSLENVCAQYECVDDGD